MTKDEIKKALMTCSVDSCKDCPYDNKGLYCCGKLKRDALELINEQEKSIQMAQDRILELAQGCQEYREQQVKQAQIDVLNKVKTLIFQKDNPYNVPFEEFISADVFCGYIDELIKEIEDAKSKGTN